MRSFPLIALFAVLFLARNSASADEVPGPDIDGYQKHVEPFFKQHCLKCHGATKPKGGLALGKLNVDLTSGKDLGKWQEVLDRLRRGEMPPEGEARPRPEARSLVTRWLTAELHKADPKLLTKESGGRHHDLPGDGNRVPHEELFGFEAKPGGASPPRIWRLSPQAYNEMVRDLMGKSQRTPVSQPFAGLSENGIKDYAAAFTIDEPTTQQLYRNAKEIVARQTDFKNGKGGKKGSNKELAPLFDGTAPSRSTIEKAIRCQFVQALKREPSRAELDRFVGLMEKNQHEAGPEGIRATLAAILIHPEAVFRQELGAGKVDDYGRKMLAPRALAFAIAYALTDRTPDKALLDAAASGKLATKEEVARQVKRLLDDSSLDKPRILRFFREYFGYPLALDVFKDKKANPDHDARTLVNDTDRLILYVLAQDRNVLYELLTTNKSFAGYGKVGAKGKGSRAYTAYNLTAPLANQPVALPAGERAGVLTQPSWLVAYSTSFDNHAILRGKWVRERLLGGAVPDLPITVDAKLPDDPKKTLRERMVVTQEAYCWNCHQRMNDLGLPFETFDHFGRFRTKELDKPVDAAGLISLSGAPKLDGAVNDAVMMIRKLAASERVEQVFVRHAFRYWLGRNETPEDAYTLQQAHQAYRDSGGSMKALVASLLTSEAFLYRRANQP